MIKRIIASVMMAAMLFMGTAASASPAEARSQSVYTELAETPLAHGYNTCRKATHWNGGWQIVFRGAHRLNGVWVTRHQHYLGGLQFWNHYQTTWCSRLY